MSVHQSSPSAPSAPNQPSAPGISISELRSVLTPLPRSIGSERFNRIKDALVHFYKEANSAVQLGVIPMTRETYPNLDYSCLIVTLSVTESKGNLYFYLLLDAGSGDEPAPITIHTAMGPTTIHRTPGDSLDKTLVNMAIATIKTAYSTRQLGTIRYASGMVIPSDLQVSMDNEISKARLYQIATAASMACIYEHGAVHKTGDLNLALGSPRNGAYSAVLENAPNDQNVNFLGQPVRAPVRLSFRERSVKEHTQVAPNSGNGGTEFCRVSGFMDAVWAPLDNGPMNSPFYNPNAPAPKYLPRFVITGLETAVPSPGLLMLGVLMTVALRSSNYWMPLLRPTNDPLRNIGALNIEANLPVADARGQLMIPTSPYGEPLDLRETGITDAQIYAFMGKILQPTPAIAIDIPNKGPNSYFLEILLDAAGRNGEENGAYNRLISACNVLTNGTLSRYLVANTPIFVPGAAQTILGGRWQDKQGIYRDLREFDQIAACNILDKTPDLNRDFSNASLRTDIPEPARLDKMRAMIMVMSGNTAVITHTYTRLTFNGALLSAVSRALLDVVPVDFVVPGGNYDVAMNRIPAAWSTLASLGAAQQDFIRPYSFHGGTMHLPTTGRHYQ